MIYSALISGLSDLEFPTFRWSHQPPLDPMHIQVT